MSIIMKNKLSATALAIATVMGMGYSAMAMAAAEGDTSTVFTGTINITSDNTCKLTVTKPQSADFVANWTKSGNTTTLGVTSGLDPVLIKVVASSDTGTTCKLNNIQIGTQVTTGDIAPNSNDEAYSAPFGSSGGYWRFSPSLASLALYTDNAFTTPATGTITVTDASGTKQTVLGSKQKTGNTTIDGLAAMGSQTHGYLLTDSYFASGFVPLSTKSKQYITYATSATEDIESAEIGVGGIIGQDPETATGTVDINAAANEDVATLTWVTTISEA